MTAEQGNFDSPIRWLERSIELFRACYSNNEPKYSPDLGMCTCFRLLTRFVLIDPCKILPGFGT